jgi:hypothetical protein
MLFNELESTVAFSNAYYNHKFDYLSSHLTSLLLLHAAPILGPLFKQFHIPPWFLYIERERERERERLSRKEARREVESSLEEELTAVEHFPSAEIGGPTGLECDIEEIGWQSRSRARRS